MEHNCALANENSTCMHADVSTASLPSNYEQAATDPTSESFSSHLHLSMRSDPKRDAASFAA